MKSENIDITRILTASLKWGVVMLLVGVSIVAMNSMYDTVSGALSALETKRF
jgi:hypothetical protein